MGRGRGGPICVRTGSSPKRASRQTARTDPFWRFPVRLREFVEEWSDGHLRENVCVCVRERERDRETEHGQLGREYLGCLQQCSVPTHCVFVLFFTTTLPLFFVISLHCRLNNNICMQTPRCIHITPLKRRCYTRLESSRVCKQTSMLAFNAPRSGRLLCY